MIVVPKYVSLDTSSITRLAKDFFSGDTAMLSEVVAIKNALCDNGWFVTVTSEHLIELAQHSDDEVVCSRFKFLRSFENLAWIWNVERTGIGGFLDIDCFEIRAFVDKNIVSKRDIASHAKEGMIVFGSGKELLGDNYDEWLQLADSSKPGLANSQSTASILRAETVEGIGLMKIREFLELEHEAFDNVPAKAGRLAAKMAQQIDQHGDKRVKESNKLAASFFRQTIQHMGDIEQLQNGSTSGAEFVKGVASVFEIPESVVDVEMTVGELGDLGHFARMLRIYSRKLRRTTPLTLLDVRPSDLPSWTLRLQLRDFQKQAQRVSGSDFGDRNLASLIPYLDSCEVDKRTQDYLRRITEKSRSDFSYLNHYFKCSDYRNLLSELPASQ